MPADVGISAFAVLFAIGGAWLQSCIGWTDFGYVCGAVLMVPLLRVLARGWTHAD